MNNTMWCGEEEDDGVVWCGEEEAGREKREKYFFLFKLFSPKGRESYNFVNFLSLLLNLCF